MKRFLGLVLGIIVSSQPITATALEMVLTTPPEKMVAGQPAQIVLYIYNPTHQSQGVALPGSLVAHLQTIPPTDPLVVTVAAGVTSAEIIIAPGQFYKTDLKLVLPPNLNGPVTLAIVDLPVRPLMFTVSPAATIHPDQKPEKAAGRPLLRPDTLADDFFGHEPVYFLVGPDPTHAKFQISFKYRLLNPKGSLARRWQRFENIYFGYTQTSFWDWESASAPFYDSSYKPELFYYRPDIPQDNLPGVSRFSFQGGVLHESNGKAGGDSRSLNMAYLKPGFLIETGPRHHLFIAPRAWVYIGDLSDNPDIARYRGHCDLEVAWKLQDSWKLAATLRKGTGAGKGSAQFDATYPIGEILRGNLDVYLNLQYYSGFAETLLSYNQSHDYFRIGFSMFR